MAESEIIIPLEILQLIDEHQRLVQEAAISQNKIAELEHFAQKVPASASKRTLSFLTEESTPISELNVVLQKLPHALSQIQQLEVRVQNQQRAMQQNQFQPSPRVSRPSPAPVPSSTPPRVGSTNVKLWIIAGVVIVIVISFLLLHR